MAREFSQVVCSVCKSEVYARSIKTCQLMLAENREQTDRFRLKRIGHAYCPVVYICYRGILQEARWQYTLLHSDAHFHHCCISAYEARKLCPRTRIKFGSFLLAHWTRRPSASGHSRVEGACVHAENRDWGQAGA